MNGDFATRMDILLMEDLHSAISESHAWEFVKKDPGEDGFLFSKNPMMGKIISNMKYMNYHSGASFACMMRLMQVLAVIGPYEFQTLYFPE